VNSNIRASASSESAGSALATQLAGKYMVFRLAEQEHALQILKVRELIGLLPITRLPASPPAVRGVINLRGRVIPVMDLRLRFGMPPTVISEQSVIIVVQYQQNERELTMGLLVDEAVEVLNIGAAQIEPPPDFGDDGDGTNFILGIGKTETRVICLLDVDKVMTSPRVEQMHEVLEAAYPSREYRIDKTRERTDVERDATRKDDHGKP
jgi:purine-binding chemotaxis protein CheW